MDLVPLRSIDGVTEWYTMYSNLVAPPVYCLELMHTVAASMAVDETINTFIKWKCS